MSRLVPWSPLFIAMFVCGCASTPKVRSIVQDTYVIEAVEGAQNQIKENITVVDLGEAQKVIQPVKVLACVGDKHRVKVTRKYTGTISLTDVLGERHVLEARDKPKTYKDKDEKGNDVIITETPIYEEVSPLLNHYVRRFKITNDTEHTLRLDRVDVVLIDGAGNDLEGLDKETLEQNIRAERPCSSTDVLIRTINSLKLLGADTRVRPSREATFLAVFHDVDKSILGDWTLELIDFPVATNEAGQVTRVTSFQFPLTAKLYRTTIQQRKEGLMSPWKETGRDTKEIEQ